ncbi:MAG: DUF6266 family protein [Puia sp.]
MAKFSQGINGPFYGKVGAVVGYTWKGIPVMRGLPKSRTKPFTPKELNQQAKFRLMNGFLTPLNDLFNVTFAHLAVQMSAYNKAFSYNIKNATTGFGPDLAIDYNMVLISRGDLPRAELVAVIRHQLTCCNSPGVIIVEREKQRRLIKFLWLYFRRNLDTGHLNWISHQESGKMRYKTLCISRANRYMVYWGSFLPMEKMPVIACMWGRL